VPFRTLRRSYGIYSPIQHINDDLKHEIQFSHIEPLKTKIDHNYVYIFSSHRAVNTPPPLPGTKTRRLRLVNVLTTVSPEFYRDNTQMHSMVRMYIFDIYMSKDYFIIV
jgi:hypothetical protein